MNFQAYYDLSKAHIIRDPVSIARHCFRNAFHGSEACIVLPKLVP